jgi:uncharacterized protein YkwD
MNKYILFPLLFLASCLLVSCGASPSKELFPAQPLTGAETSLYNEINKVRSDAGKKAIKRSSTLDALAASESARLVANVGSKPDATALRKRAGYGGAVILVGTLRDRGPETGAIYPSHWMKSEREKGHLLGDWYRMGVGTAKSKTGELVSIVIFGNAGGVSLMTPMIMGRNKF